MKHESHLSVVHLWFWPFFYSERSTNYLLCECKRWNFSRNQTFVDKRGMFFHFCNVCVFALRQFSSSCFSLYVAAASRSVQSSGRISTTTNKPARTRTSLANSYKTCAFFVSCVFLLFVLAEAFLRLSLKHTSALTFSFLAEAVCCFTLIYRVDLITWNSTETLNSSGSKFYNQRPDLL